MEWHKGFPKENGAYLVTVEIPCGFRYVRILSFAKDLYKIDEYDFNDKQGIPGWFDYSSEWGHSEWDNVIAWAERPEPCRD